MPVIFIVFFIVFVSVSIFITASQNKNNSKNNNDKGSGLEHSNCDTNVGDNCFHEYTPLSEDDYNKVCKNCGHRNDKKHKKCSVCGRRLFL